MMRNFLKKFKKAFCDVFKNNLRYEQIKDRVVITKIMTKANCSCITPDWWH